YPNRIALRGGGVSKRDEDRIGWGRIGTRVGLDRHRQEIGTGRRYKSKIDRVGEPVRGVGRLKLSRLQTRRVPVRSVREDEAARSGLDDLSGLAVDRLCARRVAS